MHGPGHAPPQQGRPADGTLAALRALFAALTLLSCGFLGWVAFLRLAVLTKRPGHWALLVLAVVSNIGLLVFAGAVTPTDENVEMSDSAALSILGWLLVNVVGVLCYYIYAELRHFEGVPPRAAVPPAGLPQPGMPPAGYGYPPAGPQTTGHPPLPQQQPPHHTPVPPQPPAPQQPAPPQRIGQVRAELDELSELLRREERDR
ncbi:hypothetical protein LG634_15635 [Streptomyces bambusae]|uniref:hypothetical protein n=1 Tax=Streptomyces bambusae TaxID=1550616 RepID=UPI001CFE7F32|nr:hypothetical protein [Streptomyces bambusae]MCB5166261.1 hypothetical protein [Streptomyces bambusae]